MPSKKELERRIVVLEKSNDRILEAVRDRPKPRIDLTDHSGYLKQRLDENIKGLDELFATVSAIVSSHHAPCPACDEMCERRKMVEWPGPPSYESKSYCYSCHEKIKKAHGKEGANGG